MGKGNPHRRGLPFPAAGDLVVPRIGGEFVIVAGVGLCDVAFGVGVEEFYGVEFGAVAGQEVRLDRDTCPRSPA
jgi:hypothetical protein